MSRITGALVALFERFLPDPFIFAVLLTLLTGVLAALFAPHRGLFEILGGWYAGIFGILEFALQMILVLVSGYALANSRQVARVLDAIASLARTPRAAAALVAGVSALACLLNWGFGLVSAALLARAVARRMRIDFGWIVAAAYSGFVVWASGLSSSIALAQATHGSKLNIVEQLTGAVTPLSGSLGAAFNVVPVVALLVLLPVLFAFLQPPPEQTIAADPAAVAEEAEAPLEPARTFAERLERAWMLNVLLAAAGITYLAHTYAIKGFSLDIDGVIFIFIVLGLLLHGRPIAYVRAVNRAARITGPLILQYPLYGGIMGIMTATGLAGTIAQAFVAASRPQTLPLLSYAASIVISIFVPSGGGHWAVQGPFVVPAAQHLHASQPAAFMAVAMGEQVANMIQPFWALPVIAVAGIGIRRVMGFTALTFAVSAVVFALALWLLVPRS